MPGQGICPYFAPRCPQCLCFQACESTFGDDSGYETLGFCRHPRIGMEPFPTEKLDTSKSDRCRLYAGRVRRRPDSIQPDPLSLG